MTTLTPPKKGKSTPVPGKPAPPPTSQTGEAETLAKIKALLDATPTKRSTKATIATAPSAVTSDVEGQIRVYEDDPDLIAVDGADPVPAEPIVEDLPVNEHDLQTEIVGDQPAAGLHDPGTPEFVYWNAAAALARGINFWAPLLPDGTVWSTDDGPMRITLDDGVDLNAFYARPLGLVFFHDDIEGNRVNSAESPDVVCHELGHALLDAFKPELFDAASLEVAAFHEAFGDMSGMLSALQVPTMRRFVLEQTGGDLTLNSRLSQMARELGWAIRQFAPDAVDVDCLRNAANSFFYTDPTTLPPNAPAGELSSEPHSFSRVFSGAFLDVLAGMFLVGPAGNPGDDSEKLAAVARDVGRLLVDGIRVAAVGAGFYSQVAAGMVQADQSLFGGRYRNALTSAFVRRGILAPESAVALSRNLRTHAGREFGVAGAGRGQHLQFEGDNEGFRRTGADAPTLPLRPLATRFGVTLHVHLPTEPTRFGVAAAAVRGGAERVHGAEEDARSFVEDLIQRGRIDDTGAEGTIPEELLPVIPTYPTDKTHRLIKADGKVVLKRHHFCCGYRGTVTCRQVR